MKKLGKILGIVLLVFVVIIIVFVVKNFVDVNRGSNEPPVTNNGGDSGNNNNNTDSDKNNNSDNTDDPDKNNGTNPIEPEKEVYTKYEPVDELIRKFNVVAVDSFCVEGFQNGKDYCVDTPLVVSICWFGGGSLVKEAIVESLNMIMNHPDFEQLNKEKKIALNIDVTYVKALHANTIYSFNFAIFGHMNEASAQVSTTDRVETNKEKITIKQEEVNIVYETVKKYI